MIQGFQWVKNWQIPWWEWKRGNKKGYRKRKRKQMRKDKEKEKGKSKRSSWWSCPKTRRPLSVRAEASPPYQPRCSPVINQSSVLPFLSTSSQLSIDYHTTVLLLSFLSLWLVWSSLQEHNNRISCEDDVDDDVIDSEIDISEYETNQSHGKGKPSHGHYCQKASKSWKLWSSYGFIVLKFYISPLNSVWLLLVRDPRTSLGYNMMSPCSKSESTDVGDRRLLSQVPFHDRPNCLTWSSMIMRNRKSTSAKQVLRMSGIYMRRRVIVASSLKFPRLPGAPSPPMCIRSARRA